MPARGLPGCCSRRSLRWGSNASLAHTGREAFQLASSGPVDLAIVDFHLPDGPAEELVRALQGVRPGIILLGIPPDNDPDNPLIPMLGMQGAITKPFYLPDLVPYIAGLLGADVPSLAEVFPEELETDEEAAIKPPPPKKSTRSVPWLENAGRAGAWLEQIRIGEFRSGLPDHARRGTARRSRFALTGKTFPRRAARFPDVVRNPRRRHRPICPAASGRTRRFFLYSISLALNFDLTLAVRPEDLALRGPAQGQSVRKSARPAAGHRNASKNHRRTRRDSGTRRANSWPARRKTGDLPPGNVGPANCRKPGAQTGELPRSKSDQSLHRTAGRSWLLRSP